MKLVDKDALVAEIERRITNIKEYCCRKGHDTRFDVVPEQLSLILSFIDTLEVKEVDFETAFVASIDHFDEKNNYGPWPESDLRGFAEHFFELGLKTQKVE